MNIFPMTFGFPRLHVFTFPVMLTRYGSSFRRYMVEDIRALVMICIFIFFSAPPVHGQTIRYVAISGDDVQGENICTDMGEPCRSIAHAINMAADSDTVKIAMGVYTEMLTIEKSLSLMGDGMDVTIIQAHSEPGMADDRVIRVSGDQQILIKDITIRHGKTTGLGGGISNGGGKVTLANTRIANNMADTRGGAINNIPSGFFNGSTGRLIISQSIIEYNEAGDGGGAIDNQGGEVTIMHSMFDGNQLGLNGGAILNNSGKLSISNSTISGNGADGSGGGIFSFNFTMDVQVENTIIAGNTAGVDGGGIFNGFNSSLSLLNSTIGCPEIDDVNIAGRGGGGIYNNAMLHITSSIVIGNEAHGDDGGGIYNDNNGKVKIDGNSMIHKNISTTDSGGGITNFDSLRISDSVVELNHAAGGGGGIWNGNGKLHITNSTIRENSAVSDGGGIYNTGLASVLTLAKVTIFKNEADANGGGIINAAGNVSITNSSIIDNKASDNGGGLHGYSGSVKIIGSVISGNLAGGSGGGFSINGHLLSINSTMSGNTAITGGGIYNGTDENGSESTLMNTIIWGNKAQEGGNEIANSNAGEIFLRYSLYRNEPGDVIESNGFRVDEHTITENPLFINSETGDMRLRAGSPSINAGDPDVDLSIFHGGSLAPVDLDDNPRIQFGRIDMGAYEFQGPAAPVLLSPVNQSAGVQLPVALEWVSETDSEIYHLQLTLAEKSFSEAIIDDDNVQSKEYWFFEPDDGSKYKWRVRALTGNLVSDWSEIWEFTTVMVTNSGNPEYIPHKTLLEQNYPNPFNPATVIRYQLSSDGHVSLKIFDLLGKEISILVNEKKPSGYYEAYFDAAWLAGGVYFYRLTTQDFNQSRKLMLVK